MISHKQFKARVRDAGLRNQPLESGIADYVALAIVDDLGRPVTDATAIWNADGSFLLRYFTNNPDAQRAFEEVVKTIDALRNNRSADWQPLVDEFCEILIALDWDDMSQG
jgi:hypothetical protein